MKLKELYKKYPKPDYIIIPFCRSKKDNTSTKVKDYMKGKCPWYNMHDMNRKEIYNTEVIDYIIDETEEKSFVFSATLEFKRVEIVKGTIYVLVKK